MSKVISWSCRQSLNLLFRVKYKQNELTTFVELIIRRILSNEENGLNPLATVT